MRIAYICADPGVPVFGRKGSSVHVQAIVGALQAQGAQVTLLASRFDGSVPPHWRNVCVRALPNPPKGDLAQRERLLLAANDALATILSDDAPFDLVYERYALWSYAGMEWARAHNTPGLLEVNAPLIDEQAEHRGLHDRAGAEAVAGRVFGAATALLAVSDGVAAYLKQFPAARERVQIVPNGVDPDRFTPDRDPALPRAENAVTIGFVGTLKPWHGLETLLDAFDRLHRAQPHTRLLIVGDGPLRDTLAAEIAQRGLGACAQMVGAVDPTSVPAYLRAMDIAVAPYPALERFYFSPLKVFEYMAAGVPVVASAIGQIGAVVHHGTTGMLCPPGDASALATTLARLASDRALRERLGTAGRAAVVREHTWAAVAQRILRFAA